MVNIHGRVTFKFRDGDGRLLLEYETNNLIVNDGKEIMAKRLGGNTWDLIDAISIGDDGTAPVITDDDLIGSVLGADASTNNSFVSPNIERFVGQITLSGKQTQVIREAILADVPSGAGAPPAFARALISPTITIPTATEFVDVLWEIQFN